MKVSELENKQKLAKMASDCEELKKDKATLQELLKQRELQAD
jgi:hypothetical protein